MVDIKDVLEKEFESNEISLDRDKIRNILEANDGARIRTWLSICSRCGLCAESCFVYLANDRDPRLSPAYKFHHTLGAMYRCKGQVNEGVFKTMLRDFMAAMHHVQAVLHILSLWH